MIFFTSACDLPQKEQRVMREDLAMEKGGAAGARVSRVQYVLTGGRSPAQAAD